MASEQVELIYGGGHVGIMGVVADAVLKGGGRVTGVIPQKLMDLEVAHDSVTELIVVESMHERKRIMYDRSDAFVVLPGGIGTLDEFFEVWTWQQIGYHEKPVYLYNHRGFYDHLIKHLDSIVEAGFFAKKDRDLLQSYADLEDLWVQVNQALLQAPKT